MASVARFMGEGEEVILADPTVPVSIVRYLEAEGLTTEADIPVHMQSTTGSASHTPVLFSCSRLSRAGARVSDVFQFHGEVLGWENQRASIRSNSNFTSSSCVHSMPVGPGPMSSFKLGRHHALRLTFKSILGCCPDPQYSRRYL